MFETSQQKLDLKCMLRGGGVGGGRGRDRREEGYEERWVRVGEGYGEGKEGRRIGEGERKGWGRREV